MPLPIITVPAFPNVPNVPGVPALRRATSGLVNVLSASITGDVNTTLGTFVGNVTGDISQVNGLVNSVRGVMNGFIDGDNNVSGFLSGTSSGSILGVFSGYVDPIAGSIIGQISGVISELTGAKDVMNSDSSAAAEKAQAPKWGIYLDGALVLSPDSVYSFEAQKDYRVSSYPIEGGAFESYNKVETPGEPRLTVTKGGTEADRAAFVQSVIALVASMELYSIVTPSLTANSMTFKHWDYAQRADQGANLIVLDLIAEEIRVTAAADFTNTAAPEGEATVNGGPVQAQPPSTDQLNAASGGAQ